MENSVAEIVKNLKNKKQTISFMESCTGGFLTSQITNVEGASRILKVSAVTYSNEYKIKFGVNKKTIDTYTVYSAQTAKEMAKQVSAFANSNYGIGITGEIGTVGNVYYSIYNTDTNKFFSNCIFAKGKNREEKKRLIARQIFEDLLKLLEQ